MDLFWTDVVVAFNMFTVLQIDPISSNFSSWCRILNETMLEIGFAQFDFILASATMQL
jgi:hypothetical protein